MKLTELVQLLEPPNKHFSGYLFLSNQKVAWGLIFIQGQLLYAEDKRHAVRRWSRNIEQYFPNYDWRADLTQPADCFSWQVRILDNGIHCQRLSLVRAKLMLRNLLQECLFELSLCDRLDINWQPTSLPVSRSCQSIALSSWESKMIFGKVDIMHKQWQEIGLMQWEPTLSPTLKKDVQASQLSTNLPVDHAYLRGDFTLWEIAGQLNKQPGEVAETLLPFIHEETLDFLAIADFPIPNAQATAPNTAPQQISVAAQIAQSSTALEVGHTRPQAGPSDCVQPLIACIDDSPVLTHSLKKMLGSVGYRTLIIQEPMRGFSQLIDHRPALILLDLMLPNADGYSVCKFLRNTPVFEKTPIIILTGQSKPIDRARASLAGATEFLVKPPKRAQLLEMIGRYAGLEACINHA